MSMAFRSSRSCMRRERSRVAWSYAANSDACAFFSSKATRCLRPLNVACSRVAAACSSGVAPDAPMCDISRRLDSADAGSASAGVWHADGEGGT